MAKYPDVVSIVSIGSPCTLSWGINTPTETANLNTYIDAVSAYGISENTAFAQSFFSDTINLVVKANSVSGYRFVGWYTSPNDTVGNPTASQATKLVSSKVQVNTSVIVSASKWNTGNANVYFIYPKYSYGSVKISYNPDGGAVSPSYVYANPGDSVTLPTPTRAGYTFLGWTTNLVPDYSIVGKGGQSYTVPNSDITLYAVWESTESHSSGDVIALINPNGVVVGSYTCGWTNAQGFYFTWDISNPIVTELGVKYTYYYIALRINVRTSGWKKLIKYESTGSWSSKGSELDVLAIRYPPSAVMYYHGDSLLYRASTGRLVHRNGNLLYGPKYYTLE